MHRLPSLRALQRVVGLSQLTALNPEAGILEFGERVCAGHAGTVDAEPGRAFLTPDRVWIPTADGLGLARGTVAAVRVADDALLVDVRLDGVLTPVRQEDVVLATQSALARCPIHAAKEGAAWWLHHLRASGFPGNCSEGPALFPPRRVTVPGTAAEPGWLVGWDASCDAFVVHTSAYGTPAMEGGPGHGARASIEAVAAANSRLPRKRLTDLRDWFLSPDSRTGGGKSNPRVAIAGAVHLPAPWCLSRTPLQLWRLSPESPLDVRLASSLDARDIGSVLAPGRVWRRTHASPVEEWDVVTCVGVLAASRGLRDALPGVYRERPQSPAACVCHGRSARYSRQLHVQNPALAGCRGRAVCGGLLSSIPSGFLVVLEKP